MYFYEFEASLLCIECSWTARTVKRDPGSKQINRQSKTRRLWEVLLNRCKITAKRKKSMRILGASEMIQELRALPLLPGNLGSSPRTYMAAHSHLYL